jgi:hypothetical protein
VQIKTLQELENSAICIFTGKEWDTRKTSKAQLGEKPAVLACLEPLLQNCLDSLSNKEQDVIPKMEKIKSDGLN